jgi:LPXTG-motif cell wall-anchored protein
VAGRLAVTFSGVFVMGALAVSYTTGSKAPLAAAAMGIAMLSVAVALLVRARRRVATLTKRRDELERVVGGRNS